MKNILFFTALDIWSMGDKKGAPSLYRTIKGFSEGGWQVHLVISNNNLKCNDNINENIIVYRFDIPWIKRVSKLKTVGFFIRLIYRQLCKHQFFNIGKRIIKKNTIEIIYAYEVDAVPAAKRISEKYKLPLVTRFQGTILTFDKIGSLIWRIRLWEHFIALKQKSDLLIMTNDGTQGDKILEELGNSNNKVRFWMNGVDKNIFIPKFDKMKFKEDLGINASTKVLLTVSRLVYWKRVDRIISALPKVIEQYKDFKLIIIGDGEARDYLEKLSKDLSVNEYIIFLGATSQEDVKLFMNCADIFISLYDLSNVGNPLLEAMSCGKPILTLNNGDTNKYIMNYKTGVILNTNEISMVPERVVELLKDDELKETLGKNAFDFAQKNFWTWEKRMKTEIETVENLLKQ